MIKSIFIPLLDSINHTNALRLGALMALRMHKSIHLLKVIAPQPILCSSLTQAYQAADATATLSKSFNKNERFSSAKKEVEKIKDELITLTSNRIAIDHSIYQGNIIRKICQYSTQNPEAVLILSHENKSQTVKSLQADITTQLLGNLNSPMMVLPEKTDLGSIKRILYIAEDLYDIEEGIDTITQLDPTTQAHVHIILSFNGTQNPMDWNSDKLETKILAGIQYPNTSLEIRAEKDLYPIAQAKIAINAVDLIVLHHKSLNFMLERLYLPGVARETVFTTERPLLILPDLD